MSARGRCWTGDSAAVLVVGAVVPLERFLRGGRSPRDLVGHFCWERLVMYSDWCTGGGVGADEILSGGSSSPDPLLFICRGFSRYVRPRAQVARMQTRLRRRG